MPPDSLLPVLPVPYSPVCPMPLPAPLPLPIPCPSPSPSLHGSSSPILASQKHQQQLWAWPGLELESEHKVSWGWGQATGSPPHSCHSHHGSALCTHTPTVDLPRVLPPCPTQSPPCFPSCTSPFPTPAQDGWWLNSSFSPKPKAKAGAEPLPALRQYLNLRWVFFFPCLLRGKKLVLDSSKYGNR